MDLGLKGKVAIVAASSKGLGKAIALELAREGASIVICSRNERELLATAQEIGLQTGADVLAIPADMTRPGDIDSLVEKTVQRFGKINILVNNAGGPPAGAFETFGDEDWAKALELNLLSTIRLTRAVVPHLKRQNGGRIINLTSISVKQPLNDLILSNTARTGVIGFTKSISNELAKYNITANSVLPGYIATDRTKTLLDSRSKKNSTTVEQELGVMEAGVPLGRLGKPEEFAAAVAFLASDRASYITGVSIQIDGGLNKGLM